jgi:multimeric flavodoxin WrbA
MKVAAIYGSPRKNGNSAQMMEALLSEFPESAEIHKIYLTDYNFSGCGTWRDCLTLGYCNVEDEMQKIYKELLWAEIILFASSSQFGDVTVDLKKLIERTWPLRGKLKNKIGGYVVSARRYAESTLNTLHAFMLRHKMILGGSGAIGYGFDEGDIKNDPLALEDSHKTGKRIVELYYLINRGKGTDD